MSYELDDHLIYTPSDFCEAEVLERTPLYQAVVERERKICMLCGRSNVTDDLDIRCDRRLVV